MQRHLAAVLVADVVGYSRLLEADEAGTLSALRARRKEVLEPAVRTHSGRIVKLMGDGALVEFASAVNALSCAMAVQEGMAAANCRVDAGRQIRLRIGLSLGEVIGEGSDIYGDGVNVAARLEALAEPGGICVSGKFREEVYGKVGAGFEDLGAQTLKNMAQPVRVFRVTPLAPEPVKSDARESMPALGVGAVIQASRLQRHSIAVLPLDNMSGDPAQQYISDGITEDIITELSRFRGLAIAARHTSAQFGGKVATIAEVRRMLGVDYVVEGSVRRAGERIRITVQLIDAATGNHVWAERFERQVAEIYAVLDDVVGAIAANVEERITVAAAATARRRPTENWSAYDYLLQGRELCNFHREPEAVPFFERAVAIDPDFAHAHGWLGLAHAASFMFLFDRALLDRAIEEGRCALSLDATEATGHWACAMGLTWKRKLEPAGRHFDRAIALNPADLQIRADRANWLIYSGRTEAALADVDEALRQGPFAPGWFHGVRGRALFDLRRYAESVAALDNMPEKSLLALTYLIAGYAMLGNTSAAEGALAEARRERPGLSTAEIEMAEPFAERASLEHLLEGLRRSGLES